ncbi:MAG: ATP synthase F1 subunit epsilon [Bulleidia sp.]|nr:ATP synthase F1 subunit epsilon [Bulleidia sp.]
MSTLHCTITTPHGKYKEMDTEILNVRTTGGEMGILPNHMPIVTMLKIGKMSTIENGVRQEYAVAGGLLYFRNNLAEILTDAIEGKDDIDIERAVKARERAEKRLQSGDPKIDRARAEAALARALNRLSVSGRSINS